MRTNVDLRKVKHGAGGYYFILSSEGNTRYGENKKKAIIEALENSWTEGVYITANNKIKRQLLNGSCEFLSSNNEFVK